MTRGVTHCSFAGVMTARHRGAPVASDRLSDLALHRPPELTESAVYSPNRIM
ncbi:MAG: hypothetical protein JWN20_902 [Jatrophihabitantaceae bacterium]|nr:hypothetical protein [Jatrophihabitantaceae bacterium]